MSIERQFGVMWVHACELLERTERLHRQFVRYVGPGADTAVWEPPVDIIETRDGFIMSFAMPGLDPEQIDVQLDVAGLTVSGVRRIRLEYPEAVIRRLEIPHGRFVRRIALPRARFSLAGSQYANGCLEVRLVRAPETRVPK